MYNTSKNAVNAAACAWTSHCTSLMTSTSRDQTPPFSRNYPTPWNSSVHCASRWYDDDDDDDDGGGGGVGVGGGV